MKADRSNPERNRSRWPSSQQARWHMAAGAVAAAATAAAAAAACFDRLQEQQLQQLAPLWRRATAAALICSVIVQAPRTTHIINHYTLQNINAQVTSSPCWSLSARLVACGKLLRAAGSMQQQQQQRWRGRTLEWVDRSN